MKKKLFFQIFCVALVAIILMFSISIVGVHFNSKNIIEQRLCAETQLVANMISQLDDFSVFDRYYDNNEFRITIIDSTGHVLYESDTKATLENHSDRKEFISALQDNPQPVERYSDTFQCNMTYYATKTTLSNGDQVVLRLAIKSSTITSYLGLIAPLFVVVLVLAIVICVILSSVLSKRVTAKINQIGVSLRSLNDGEYQPLQTNSSESELYSILGEINTLNLSTHNHIQNEEREHHKLNFVLDNISQGIVALSHTKQVVFANASALSLFGGHTRDVGKDLIYLIDDIVLYDELSARIGQNFHTEKSYGDKILSIILVGVDSQNLGEDICSIMIVTDITEQKKIATQKSDFFANASHELKTPVTVLQGLSELLSAKDLDSTTQKQVSRIHQETKRLSSLIGDMLKISQLENSTSLPDNKIMVDCSTTVQEIFAELSSQISDKNITAKVQGNAHIFADPKQMYELLSNLITNAIHYNKTGGDILVDLSENEDFSTIVVQDTGIGIPKESLPRLCERFYRVDKSHSKKTGGTGLGLAIVKHICIQYNATLDIESTLDVGSTFTITFPKK